MVRRYGLRDDQFVRIENLLPGRPGHVGRNSEKGNRLFVEAVIWKFRSGAPWRDLPERFGDWNNTHRRFSRWAMCGRLRVVKWLSDDAVLVGAAMCSAFECGSPGRWP
ncbi:MAG: transposase [Rhizobiales bacterium]|nr:transposase [Hyphomicrobiales bacterium]